MKNKATKRCIDKSEVIKCKDHEVEFMGKCFDPLNMVTGYGSTVGSSGTGSSNDSEQDSENDEENDEATEDECDECKILKDGKCVDEEPECPEDMIYHKGICMRIKCNDR